MTKKDLSQLRHLSKEIELLKRQIAELEDRKYKETMFDTVTGSNPEFPYQMRTFQIEGISTDWYDKRIQRLKRKLQRRLEELMDMREEIEEYIETIDDSITRQAIALKYINGLTWEQVAAHIGGGNTAAGIKKRVQRYMKAK